MLWKFILVNSNDLSHIGELSQARSKHLEVVLGKPGAASFTYPMDADYAESVQAYKSGIKAMRWNRKATEAAGHDVWDCHWSGYVLPIDETVDQNRMTVSCVGWQQRLAKRFVRRDKIYAAADDGAIVQDLLAEVNLTTTPAPDSYPVPVPAGSTPNTPTWLSWGGVQPNEGAGGATAYVDLTTIGAGRNKTVQKYTYVGSAIDELMGIEYGGDLVVDPLTRSVTWHRKYRRIRDDVVIGFQWGPQNARAFSRNLEADSQVNYLVASGAPGTTPQYAHDATQQSQIGLIEESVVLSDVKDNSVLLAYAGGEILIRNNGLITYTIQPFPLPYDRPSNVPEAFLDYRVGDQIRITAVHPPRVGIRNQAVRLFGMTIDINDDGVGTLGPLQVAP
jgi:hypothetical protein